MFARLVPTVQAKVLALVGAVALLGAACAGLFIVQTRANLTEQVFRDQDALADTYALAVEQYLAGTRSVLESLAQQPAMRAPIRPELIVDSLHGVPASVEVERRSVIWAALRGAQRQTSALMLDRDGDAYLMEPFVAQSHFTAVIRDTPQVRRTVGEGLSSWSDAITDAATGKPTVAIMVPIRDNSNRVQGAIGTALALDKLDDIARRIGANVDSNVLLFDTAGAPIVYPDQARVTAFQPLTEHPLVTRALNGELGSEAYFNPLTGQNELGTAVRLPETGWFAVVTRSQDKAFADLNRATTSLLLLMLVGTLLILVPGYLLARSIARGLRVVATAASGIAAGDLDQEVNVRSNDELGRMVDAFRDMIAYQQRMAALADAVAAGDLTVEVQPQSNRDRLGVALKGMVANLRRLVVSLEARTAQAEELMSGMRVRDRALASAASPIVIVDAQAEGRPVVYVNAAFERLTGYTADDILGQRTDVLNGPDSDPAALLEFQQALESGAEHRAEMLRYRKDGSPFWAELSVGPVRDTHGTISHHINVVTDITARKEAENQASVMARSERLRALGQMASGIAHDLNHSLMLISSYGELALRAVEEKDLSRQEMRDLLTTVRQAALDGGDTVKRLLVFSRGSSDAEKQVLDLAQVAREVIQLTAPRWRDATQVEGRPVSLDLVAKGQPVILGSSARLRDVVTNLIFNAVDALPSGGRIRLSTSVDRDMAVLSVADSGVGMPPDVVDRIFEPFFTTKGDGGSGLGLAVVFGVVENHGGKIEVDSKPGVGTTITLRFPLASITPEMPQAQTRSSSRESIGRLRILAVDDEPAMTKALQRLLRPSGHVVVTAQSGEEAIGCLERERFDVIISDMGMGAGMNGWELCATVRRTWPDIRFGLATGWGAAIEASEAQSRGADFILAKPYSADELEQVLRN
jgi:PAS domain S-box-containing protein